MCGRFIMTVDFETLKAVFRLRAGHFDVKPRYNIAPGQNIPVITGSAENREITPMRWGFIPHWARDKKAGYKMINARAETVAEKPAFRAAFRRRRCLIPASGFYEWKKDGKIKKPVLISLPGQRLFAFAGIWDRWDAPEGGTVYSCCIITTAAAPGLAGIHHRMPVIFTGEREYDLWLSPSDTEALGYLMRPYRGRMEVYPVSTRVNSPREDDPGLLRRAEEKGKD